MAQSMTHNKPPARRGRPAKVVPPPVVEKVLSPTSELGVNGILVLELKSIRSRFVVTSPTALEIASKKFRRTARVVRTPGGGATLLDEFVFSMHQLGYVVIQ